MSTNRSSPVLRHNMQQTLERAVEALNALDGSACVGVRSKGCVHQFFPLSTQSPPMNNAQYAAYVEKLSQAFQNFTFEKLETMLDDVAMLACVRGLAKADSHVGPFRNEVVIWVRFSRDGKLFEGVKEVSDSASMLDYFKRLKEALALAQSTKL